MFRKRRRPTPGFKIPPPFNPVTGNYATLVPESLYPYCALFQIAEQDVYEDYVICRGFDPRVGKFVDYEPVNPQKPGISVAKPFGKRVTQTYSVGEIYPAFLPIQGTATFTPAVSVGVNLRLGQNPGVVEGEPLEGGQPPGLSSVLGLLIDYKNEFVNWLLIDSGDKDEICEDLEDLAPGTYQGTCGEEIAPGDTGKVKVEGCDGEVEIDAKNHSNCTFYLGDRISVHIDNCCNAHFEGCNCCETPACCDKRIAVCVNGETRIITLDGFGTEWTFSPLGGNECCEVCGTYTKVLISATCTDTTITASYTIKCGEPYMGGTQEVLHEGTLDWSAICDDPPAEIEDVITICGVYSSGCCDITIVASPALNDEPCDPCAESTATPDPDCCTKQLWFCIVGLSQQLAVDGGTYTWTVTDCVDCGGVATLELDLTCTSGEISAIFSYVCAGGSASVQTFSLRQFCYSDAPMRFIVATPGGPIEVNVTITSTACDGCGVSVDCCPESVPDTLPIDIVGGIYAGSYSLIWDGGLSEWVVDGSAPFTARLACTAGPLWDLTFEMDNFGTSTESCDPFCLTMDMAGNSYGITSITIGSCGPGGVGGGI